MSKESPSRSVEAGRSVRAWLEEQGIPHSKRGKVSEAHFQFFLEENEGRSPEVISHEGVRYYQPNVPFHLKQLTRVTKVQCFYCAEVHTHGSPVADRSPQTRMAHCASYNTLGNTPSGYTIVDNTPIEQWELDAKAHNEKCQQELAA
jgi:hypothetical protein